LRRSRAFRDHPFPDAKKVLAPEFGDVRVLIAAPEEFGGYVQGLTDIHSIGQTTCVVKVRRYTDVIDPNSVHSVVDRIH
jgi:hypothetical protein